jgi:ABC-type multidrug transport system ATPase subunit
MIYCLAFLFNDPSTASRQAFLLMIIIIVIPYLFDEIFPDGVSPVVEWIYALVPALHIQRLLMSVLVHLGSMKQGIGYYWKSPVTRGALILEFVDILLYSGILAGIEYGRVYLQRVRAQRAFGDYGEYVRKEKQRHPITPEARAMEEEIATCHEGYAVRIENCSRLFFNTAGDPIPAVNCVSLGVKTGSLFGFLGANGAGKTTLMKMIMSMLPCSDGKIEILGRDIAEYNDPTIISTCPQFNTHLCSELTPHEHFILYSLLFQLDPETSESKKERLMKALELEHVQYKPIRELSGGDVRKVAIALTLLGPANIIMLDEPTASLDSVARHNVHEMITSFKHEKTFMLCTHLLSEAETLCDTISIMIKGCVYTVGSPQYLSDKFGTEFKVDVMLSDGSEDSARACDAFFAEHFPEAILSIARPQTRIYTVPASSITLPRLFTLMEEGKERSCGFNYYTCSSSSLERVFMEIVHMSELRDEVLSEE